MPLAGMRHDRADLLFGFQWSDGVPRAPYSVRLSGRHAGVPGDSLPAWEWPAMRYTQPLNSEENAIDLALRKQYHTHAAQDEALILYRLAVQRQRVELRAPAADRLVDLMTGIPSC